MIGAAAAFAFDRPRKRHDRQFYGRERNKFAKIRRAEEEYARQLRKVARHVGDLINGFAPGDPALVSELRRILEQYGRILEPWARATAGRMLAEVMRRDEAAWAETAKIMGRTLRREIREAPTGQVMRQLMDEQVGLITSLPIEAAQRVHSLTIEFMAGGRRASEIVPMILASGQVTVSRANTIARTETSRAASTLTEARATFIGSPGYTWRTARDRDVRESHRKMEGQFVPWGSPPTLDGLTGHAGRLPNCRCYPEPLVPDVF